MDLSIIAVFIFFVLIPAIVAHNRSEEESEKEAFKKLARNYETPTRR